jgi:hypothetical protein
MSIKSTVTIKRSEALQSITDNLTFVNCDTLGYIMDQIAEDPNSTLSKFDNYNVINERL